MQSGGRGWSGARFAHVLGVLVVVCGPVVVGRPAVVEGKQYGSVLL
jgi:hypothetical protein